MMLHCHKHENQLRMRAKVFKVKCGHMCIMDESRSIKINNYYLMLHCHVH